VTAASPADWAACLSLGAAVSAAAAVPVLLWVDADYVLVPDWRVLGDRLLVEVTNVRHAARDARRAAAVTGAGLLLLLSAPTVEVTR
jgi:hypothetical protein